MKPSEYDKLTDDQRMIMHALEDADITAYGEGLHFIEALIAQRRNEYYQSDDFIKKIAEQSKKRLKKNTSKASLEKYVKSYVGKLLMVGDIIKVVGTRDNLGMRKVLSIDDWTKKVVCVKLEPVWRYNSEDPNHLPYPRTWKVEYRYGKTNAFHEDIATTTTHDLGRIRKIYKVSPAGEIFADGRTVKIQRLTLEVDLVKQKSLIHD